MLTKQEHTAAPDEEIPSGLTPTQPRRTRGLVAGAVALLVIPSAIGFVMLRSDTVPAGPAFLGGGAQQIGNIESSDDLLQPIADSDTGPARILYRGPDDEQIGIPNGGAIPLGNDLQLEVFLAQFPPTSFTADIDFYLTTTTGDPVTDADLTISWDMLVMSHGLLVTEPQDIGGGHYLASFRFVMYGPWEFDISVALDGTAVAQTAMSIYVWPA